MRRMWASPVGNLQMSFSMDASVCWVGIFFGARAKFSPRCRASFWTFVNCTVQC